MNILESLQQLFDNAKVQEISKKVGINPDKIKSTIEKVLPNLLGNLSEQLKSGKSSILNFLDKDKDGDIMDDLSNMFGFGKKKKQPQAMAAAPSSADIFADKKQEVTDLIKEECDVDDKKASNFLDEITKTVMGFLGQKGGDAKGLIDNIIKQGDGLKGKLGDQLKNVMGSLDKDKDGDVMDDLEDMGKKLFGGLFGKKKR